MTLSSLWSARNAQGTQTESDYRITATSLGNFEEKARELYDSTTFHINCTTHLNKMLIQTCIICCCHCNYCIIIYENAKPGSHLLYALISMFETCLYFFDTMLTFLKWIQTSFFFYYYYYSLRKDANMHIFTLITFIRHESRQVYELNS